MTGAAGSRLRLPPVIGHRGAAGLAPENTLAAMRAAGRAGARWVEFDVRLSRDLECVVVHDTTLERTTGRRASVSRTRSADMRRMDAGSWFSSAYSGETIPRLGDALALLSSLGLGANVELKPCGRRNRALVTAMLATIRRSRCPGDPPVLISSFSPALLQAVRRRDPAMPLGLLLKARWRRDWRRIAHRLGCVSVHCAERGLTAGAVQHIRSAGFAVAAYTVNDPARARELRSWGVDSLISDVPDVLVAAEPGRRNI